MAVADVHKYHGISISRSTLLRRLKQLGLSKRDLVSDSTMQKAMNRIRTVVTGRTRFSRSVPSRYYLSAVKEFGGCPVKIISELGTENFLVVAIQSFFRDSDDAHKYVPSPRNQRIESWW
eukprot:gene3979-4528_t